MKLVRNNWLILLLGVTVGFSLSILFISKFYSSYVIYVVLGFFTGCGFSGFIYWYNFIQENTLKKSVVNAQSADLKINYDTRHLSVPTQYRSEEVVVERPLSGLKSKIKWGE